MQPTKGAAPTAENKSQKQYTFEDAARLVCKGADPPVGLANFFRLLVRLDELIPNLPPVAQISRKDMVEALKDIVQAAEVILKGLHGPPAGFIMASTDPPFDRVALVLSLHDLINRSLEAILKPTLASSSGGVKRGPGRVANPHGKTRAEKCAAIVLFAWRQIHGEFPGSRNDKAAEAAEALYQLATVGSPRSLAQSTRSTNLSTKWRASFEKARAQDPLFGPAYPIVLSNFRLAIGRVFGGVAQFELGPGDNQGGANSA